jgi:hypothetical protein
MPLKGNLKRQLPFTIEIDNNSILPMAITVVPINVRGGMNAAPTTIAPQAANHVLNEILGPRINRLLVYVTLGENSRATVRVNQGAWVATSDDIQGDAILVFDVIP